MRSRAFGIVVLSIIATIILAFMVIEVSAHDWYPGTTDPVNGTSCCGTSDCHIIPAKWLIQEGDGWRVRLTLEQAKYVNEEAVAPVDAFVPRSRVQESKEANFAVCIFASNRTAPGYGVICFFEPPQS